MENKHERVYRKRSKIRPRNFGPHHSRKSSEQENISKQQNNKRLLWFRCCFFARLNRKKEEEGNIFQLRRRGTDIFEVGRIFSIMYNRWSFSGEGRLGGTAAELCGSLGEDDERPVDSIWGACGNGKLEHLHWKFFEVFIRLIFHLRIWKLGRNNWSFNYFKQLTWNLYTRHLFRT